MGVLKIAGYFMKYVVTPIGAIVGGYMAFEAWTSQVAKAEVKPVQMELTAHISQGELTKSYFKASLDRLELESRMMRSNQDETNRLLVKLINNP